MTSLICLVMRCNLSDGRLIKENELFECGAKEAEVLIRGGIAKAATVAVPVKPEAPKEIQQEPEEEVIVTPRHPCRKIPQYRRKTNGAKRRDLNGCSSSG